MKQEKIAAIAKTIAEYLTGKNVELASNDEETPLYQFAAGEPVEIEIARPGTFTDMHGREVPLTRDDLRGIASRFTTGAKHFLKLGHKKTETDTPVYGRAVAARYDDSADRLKATVVPTQLGVEANQKGEFKFCSLEAEPTDDGLSLTDIGMLAMWEPAIDGLASFAFGAAPEDKTGVVLAQTEKHRAEKPLYFLAKYNQADRDRMAKTGAAEADGSFPIGDEEDLHNAINDWGRAGAKPSDKAHIVSRAKALGLEAKLPDGWSGGSKAKVAAGSPRDKQEGSMATDNANALDERTKRVEDRLVRLAKEEVGRTLEALADRIGLKAMPAAKALFAAAAELELSEKSPTFKFAAEGETSPREISIYEGIKNFVAALPPLVDPASKSEFAKSGDVSDDPDEAGLPKLASGMSANPTGDALFLATQKLQKEHKEKTGKDLPFALAAARVAKSAGK